MEKQRIRAFFCYAVATVIACALVVSCAAHTTNDEYGSLEVSFGSHRGLETGWPSGTVPSFSSVTVTVSSSDMSSVTMSASGSSGSIKVQVPAGDNRLVQIKAVPASGSGAPYFAKSYGGSATVSLQKGETKSIPIKLSLLESKILLQDTPSYAIYSADSISGTRNADSIQDVYFTNASDPSFDQYGRLYCYDAEMGYFNRYNADLAAPEQMDVSGISDVGLSYSPSNNRLYYFNDYSANYIDVTQTEPSIVYVSYPPSLPGLQTFQKVVAVDDAGYVYGCYNASTEKGIVKLSVGAESEGSAYSTAVVYKSYSDIGLTYVDSGVTKTLTVQDLYVKDGVLYVAAADVIEITNQYASLDDCFSRGKVVALSADTLTPIWTTGWSGDANQLPTDPASQFYGPVRFVGIAPKKLYIADDGYSVTGTYPAPQTQVNQNRVVELDTDTGAFSAIGLVDEVEFFTSYSYTFFC
jgi:hypothetical protein